MRLARNRVDFLLMVLRNSMRAITMICGSLLLGGWILNGCLPQLGLDGNHSFHFPEGSSIMGSCLVDFKSGYLMYLVMDYMVD